MAFKREGLFWRIYSFQGYRNEACIDVTLHGYLGAKEDAGHRAVKTCRLDFGDLNADAVDAFRTELYNHIEGAPKRRVAATTAMPRKGLARIGHYLGSYEGLY